MRRPTIYIFALVALAFGGCQQGQDDHVPADGPPAISGGTLEVAVLNRGVIGEERFIAVAADPARSSVYLVDANEGTELSRVILEENDEPGRIAINHEEGRAYVIGRRSGDVISIDVLSGEILERRHACTAPRGIDVDVDGDNALWIACSEGVAVSMPQVGGGVTQTVKLVPDLRDVVTQNGSELYVSVFRSAEILVVDTETGEFITHEVPQTNFTDRPDMTSTVAWRMRRTSGNEVLLVHQQAQTTQLGVLAMPTAGAQYYGGSCLRGVVRSVVSRFNGNRFNGGIPIENATLVVDGDVAGSSIALAAAAESGVARDRTTSGSTTFNGVRSVSMDSMAGTGGCFGGSAPEHFGRPASATAVATLPDGHVVALYRDPAEIVIGRITSTTSPFGGPAIAEDSIVASVALSGGSVAHPGHALMHEAAGSGAACASCHPEGGDDGHVWQFDVGQRRTQTMTGGLLQTAPFHWDGNVANFNDVMEGTFVNRMGGTTPSQDEIASLETWVDAIPARPGIIEDAEAVARGEQLFNDTGCADCHSGDRGTNNDFAAPMANFMEPGSVRLRTVAVPALYEVQFHAPYMHNGVVDTLDELVSGNTAEGIEPHGNASVLNDEGRGDLVAYLRSL